jgi:hypothetical protein
MANEIPVGGHSPPQEQQAPVAAPAAAEAAPATPTPAPIVAPAVEAAPTPEPAAPAPAPEVKAEGAPEVEAPKLELAAEEKKPEGAPAEAATQTPPVYAEFKMPEGFKAEPAQISAYSNILAKYSIPQEAGQELVDFHTNELKRYSEALAQQQRDTFAETRRGWVKQVDKEFGNRRDTIINDAKWAISEFGGDKKQLQQVWEVMAFTGAGDHPAVVRLLANMAKRLREREAPGASVPNAGIRSGSPAERRYGARQV